RSTLLTVFPPLGREAPTGSGHHGCGERRCYRRPQWWPDLAATVPIDQVHRSKKRWRIATKAIEPTGMQLGRTQILLHARRARSMQLRMGEQKVESVVAVGVACVSSYRWRPGIKPTICIVA